MTLKLVISDYWKFSFAIKNERTLKSNKIFYFNHETVLVMHHSVHFFYLCLFFKTKNLNLQIQDRHSWVSTISMIFVRFLPIAFSGQQQFIITSKSAITLMYVLIMCFYVLFFFCYQQFLFLFFSHTTQQNIQNKTKQNSRHILNISRFNQKGGREGRTTRTQKSLL